MIDSVKNKRIPTKWLNSVQVSLAGVESLEQFSEILRDIKEQFDFRHLTTGVINQNNFRNELYYLYSSKSEQWKQTYVEKEYWKIDTRIIVARQQITPFQWSSRPNLAEFIFKDVMAEGILDGITIPIHGPNHFFGFLHFTYDPTQKKISSWLHYIQPFISYLAQHIVNAQSALIQKNELLPHYFNPTKNPPLLSIQQRKCLSWVAEGKTSEEIALILNISVSTVNKHLDFASALLNANNRTHAIAKAIDSNLIALEYKKKSAFFYF